MTPEKISALQALLQSDAVLAEQLQSANSAENAAQLLAQAANEKGIVIAANDIAEYIETAKSQQMSDSELDAVAGGLMKSSGFIAFSVFTFMIGCEVYTLANPTASSKKCKFKGD